MPEGVGGEFLCLAGMLPRWDGVWGGGLGRLWMNSWRAGIGFGLIWEATGCAGGTRGVIAGRI